MAERLVQSGAYLVNPVVPAHPAARQRRSNKRGCILSGPDVSKDVEVPAYIIADGSIAAKRLCPNKACYSPPLSNEPTISVVENDSMIEMKDNAARGLNNNNGEEDNSPPRWAELPSEALVCVFGQLPVQDLGRVAQVCRSWRHVTQYPELWQRFEFVLNHASKSYIEPTPSSLINFVLKHHAKHLKFVIFRTDSSIESAQSACHILSRLVNCSLKTLALISSARPVFLDVDQECFVSALTLVLDHSRALSSLAIDNMPVDDPSLKALASSNSRTLELLKMKSCPRVSPGGILALADHCRCLRELSLSYTLLSDELLLALSSEEHVRLEYLRIDVYTEKDMLLQSISPQCWQALVKHSPSMNLVMYLFMLPEESFDLLFTAYTPVTHLYFGDCLPRHVLARVSKYCPRLRELVVGANGASLIDAELLSVAANCPSFTSLGLGECEVSCSALVEFARRCGPRLAQLCVMEESLVEDSNYDVAKTCKKVSELLGRDWCPEFMPVW